ncbi:hypothetical protein HDU78_008036 [Chytriomyces hyalinus]|nr:hypothetical protein HDU78_008036 [Chytriomyces hyalinus]KAJ3260542.1 hypothetical protein HDU77_001299 [Chytriomyces hyalinus]
MLSSGPSGFYNAPVSKAVFIVSGVSSLAMSILAVHRRGVFGTLWYLVAFSTSSEVLFSSLVMYSLRLLERQFGSIKFASMLLVTSFLSLATSLGIHWLFGFRSASGPYGMLFATLLVYAYQVPVTVRIRILGFGISDKIVLYLLASQLLWAQFPRSVTPMIAGLAAGILYRSDDLPFKTFRIPTPIARFCERVFTPILGSRGPVLSSSSQQQLRQQRNAQFDPSQQQPGHQQQHAGVAAPEYTSEQQEAHVVISEESVASLVAMGFARDQVVDALRRSGGSVERAAAVLCG